MDVTYWITAGPSLAHFTRLISLVRGGSPQAINFKVDYALSDAYEVSNEPFEVHLTSLQKRGRKWRFRGRNEHGVPVRGEYHPNRRSGEIHIR